MATEGTARKLNDEQKELLENLIVLSFTAFKSFSAEFHQQTEAYIHLTGKHPLESGRFSASRKHIASNEKPTSTASGDGSGRVDDAIPIRATSGSPPLVSDLIWQLTRLCDESMAIQGGDNLKSVLNRVKTDAVKLEDKVQVLYIFDMTLQRNKRIPENQRAVDLATVFEKADGYGILVNWLTSACQAKDSQNNMLTEVMLRMMRRNVPHMPERRKRTLQELNNLRRDVVTKQNKLLLDNVVKHYKKNA